ncbi:hypothetical protein [Polaribacter sp. ALD11]|uniref:hypothetical protein n=1 Tax=Polaribacter sp. ALD11 TaxID=2058137 RepID=UPI001E3ECF75|nr:hypothetical protein [Polaribacter sp. ALD11]
MKHATNHIQNVGNNIKMTLETIYEKASGIIGINGMTVNERLYVSGLMDIFDQAKKNDKDLAKTILKALKVDIKSIEKIV